MKSAFVAILVLLAACGGAAAEQDPAANRTTAIPQVAAQPGAAATDAETYHALGTEPFWAISIDGGRITYQPNIGEPEWSVLASAPVDVPNGRQYRTDRITVTIVRGLCSDGMSDRVYADTVTVDVDGRKWLGCGVPIDNPNFLSGTHWAIAAIDGRPVEEDGYFLDFNRGRISGRAGCNHFSGDYAMDAVTLTPGPVTATEMACGEPHMARERRVLALLGGPLNIQIGIATLELVDNDGRGLLLRPRPEPVAG